MSDNDDYLDEYARTPEFQQRAKAFAEYMKQFSGQRKTDIQTKPVDPEGDAAYWRARAERAEKIAERLYQAAYCYWAEYTSATYRKEERTRRLAELERALSDYNKGR